MCLSSKLGCSSTHCYDHCIQTGGPATSSNNLCLFMRGAATGSRRACSRLDESNTFGLNLLSAAFGTVCSTAMSRQLLHGSYSACAAAGPATAAGRRTVPKSKAILFLSPSVTPGVAVTLLGTEGTPGPEPKSHTSFSRKTFAYIPLIFCPAGAATQVQWRYYRSIMQPRLLLRRLLLQLQTAVVRTLHD